MNGRRSRHKASSGASELEPSGLRRRLVQRHARRGLPHDRLRAQGAVFAWDKSDFRYLTHRRGWDGIDAAAQNLGRILALGEVADPGPFLVDAAIEGGATLGVDAQGMRSLVAALRRRAADDPFYVRVEHDDGRTASGLGFPTLRRDDVPEVPRAVLVFSLEVDRRSGRRFGARYGCRIERWDRDGRGDLLAPTLNSRSSAVSTAQFHDRVVATAYGLEVETLHVLDQPTHLDVTFPIDAVYLWVDGGDPQWQRRKAQRLQELVDEPDRDSLSAIRFEQGDELRYSLRSIARYAPWIRRIHIVTDQQRPEWLQEVPGRLDVVDHRDILPADALPTFNSHAISSALHRVPGLSDHFIVMNDDVMFGREVRPEDLFLSTGVARFFPSRSALPSTPARDDDLPLVAARRNSQDLVERLTGMRPNAGFKHTPIAMSRELLAELADDLPEWHRTQRSPFRSTGDIVPEWVHHYVGLARGLTVPGTLPYAYADIGTREGLARLRELIPNPRPAVICVNDVTEAEVGGRHRHDVLRELMEQLYPHPSPFERP